VGNAFRLWILRRGIRKPRYETVMYFAERDDMPDVPKPGVLAVAGSSNRPKWASFDCPCGRGHVILLPLQAQGRDAWRLTLDASGLPTLYPSIDRRGVPRCHFWLEAGRVRWVKGKRHPAR